MSDNETKLAIGLINPKLTQQFFIIIIYLRERVRLCNHHNVLVLLDKKLTVQLSR